MTADPKLNGFHMIWQNLPVKKSHSYRVSMRAKADAPRLFRPAVYIPKRGFMLIGALNSSLEPQTKLAKKSGLDFVSMHLGGIWTKPGGEPDYSEITAAFGRILSANPEAKIIPRIFVQPPDWWKNAHPEELMKTDDGETLYTASVTSEKYLQDGAEAIRLFIKYCEENYPDNMAGYHIADGNTGKFSMNNALNSFLQSEINNITGSALRSLDLSFGMDNSTDASGGTHTDYSFKFSKRFWNNRMKIVVGGKVSTGPEVANQNESFFDNVTLEYRLGESSDKYVRLYYDNNAYDWLEGTVREYGAGFVWRRSLQSFKDIFRFGRKRSETPLPADSTKTNSK